jgi:DNA-binding NtrC family response regulator
MLKKEIIENLRAEVAFKQIITKNPQFIEKLHHVKCAASQDINILLLGETGTGKDLCAQAIHFLSSRRDKPFITLNCGLGPIELFDSVLFGHVKGAFTNAINDHPGLVEEADKGIIFLDEINSMPPSIQVKLNRFSVTGEFRRLGENKLRKVDVRIIAATNQLLKVEIEKGNFREDLYYRLAEYVIEFPPLRMRGDDIKLLMDHFLEQYGKCYNKIGIRFSDCVYEKAKKYHWPGNVRELENIIKRCLIDAINDVITENDFPIPQAQKLTPAKSDYLDLPLQEAKIKVINDFETNYLRYHLQKSSGNVEESARQSKKHRSAFWAMLKKHNIDPQEFRN